MQAAGGGGKMDIGRIGGTGGRVEELSHARQSTTPEPTAVRMAGAQTKGDRVDISTDGQLARRALEAVRGMLSTPEADPADLRAIQTRMDEGYYDRPLIRNELADRLGGILGFAEG